MFKSRMNLRYCINCLYPGVWLCTKCYAKLIRQPNNCYICKRISNYGVTHLQCKLPQETLNSNLFLFTYNSIAKRFLNFAKFRSGFSAFPFIVDREIGRILDYLKKIDSPILLPVPIHWRRLFQRGYNQTQIISERLSYHTNIPTEVDLLLRSRYRKSQTQIQKKLRTKNVEGVFSINKKLLAHYAERNIILIDDVRTTNSTINECVKTIRQELPDSRVHAITLFTPQAKFRDKVLIPNGNR